MQWWRLAKLETFEDRNITNEQILKLKKRLNEILSERTGQSVERVTRDTERDNYMSADEARAYGLIDEVFPPRR